MKKIIHTVVIKTEPQRVFQAVATQAGLSRWWSTRVEAEERLGGIVHFTFLSGFNPDMEITVLEEPALVAWKCVGGHEAWADNTFRFEISSHDDGTQLLFSQVYAQELGDVQYGVYNFNWGWYLQSLKEYCETGDGKPFQAGAGSR